MSASLHAQLDRLTTLRLDQALASDPSPELQATSVALFGEPVPEGWLPQVLTEDPPAQEAACEASDDPFPEVLIDAVPTTRDGWLALLDRIAYDPDPDANWAHFRVSDEATGEAVVTALEVLREHDREQERRNRMILPLMGGSTLVCALLVSLVGPEHLGLLACPALLGLYRWSHRYVRFARDGLVKAMLKGLRPTYLRKRDLRQAAVFPELAQTLQTWVRSPGGLTEQDRIELDWRYRVLKDGAKEQRKLDALDRLVAGQPLTLESWRSTRPMERAEVPASEPAVAPARPRRFHGPAAGSNNFQDLA